MRQWVRRAGEGQVLPRGRAAMHSRRSCWPAKWHETLHPREQRALTPRTLLEALEAPIREPYQ
jgi:hypothetical protein